MKDQPQILSPSDGATPRGERVPMTSERALAEFKVACSVWFQHMSPDDRKKAVAAAHAAATEPD